MSFRDKIAFFSSKQNASCYRGNFPVDADFSMKGGGAKTLRRPLQKQNQICNYFLYSAAGFSSPMDQVAE